MTPIRVDYLFDGQSNNDGLVHVSQVKSKLMDCDLLKKQAANNSKQALSSEKVQRGLLDILLGPGRLYEELRQRDDDEAA